MLKNAPVADYAQTNARQKQLPSAKKATPLLTKMNALNAAHAQMSARTLRSLSESGSADLFHGLFLRAGFLPVLKNGSFYSVFISVFSHFVFSHPVFSHPVFSLSVFFLIPFFHLSEN